MPELVVIAEQLLAPVPGGTGRYTGELLRALAATAPPGWTVSSIVARHADVSAARVDGVEGPRVLPLPPRALIAAWELGLPFWPGGDAVHAPTPLAPPRVPAGRTLSVTVHDTVPWTHPETLTPRGVAWHRKMIARAARRANGVLVPTEAVAAELGALMDVAPIVAGHGVSEALNGGLPGTAGEIPGTAGVAPGTAGEIPGTAGVAPGTTGEAPRLTGEVPGLRLPPRYVLAVGTLEPRKGVHVLVEAMEHVDVPLVLVGQPGWGGVDPAELTRRGVRVLGRLSDPELATVLRGAAVLAAPSLAEGFGLPVLEAMAAGVPVVHSDAPALVEVAGGAGITVARGDVPGLASALREVLDSTDRATRLAEAGRLRASEFSWDRACAPVWTLHQRR